MKVSLIAAAMVLASSGTSFAGPLVPSDLPVLMSAFNITSMFNSGVFTATGFLGTPSAPSSDKFELKAGSFTGTGNAATIDPGWATLSIWTGTNQSSPSIFASSLVDFYYNPVSRGSIEFLFANVQGGSFNSDAPLDVTINFGFGGMSQFVNLAGINSGGTAQLRQPAAPEPTVPEPSSLLLMLAGGSAIYVSRRRIFGLT